MSRPRTSTFCGDRRLDACGVLAVAGLLFASAPTWPNDKETRWPASVLELPEGAAAFFVAETDVARIRRFDRTTDGFVAGQAAYMSIGENGTGKQRARDRKTPFGIYFVIDRFDTSRLHEKYGVMAFPLDYPNALDRRRGRGGGGIWIHGVERGLGRRPPLDTDGCLALPNEDLISLDHHFVPNVTPVVVTPRAGWRTTGDRNSLVELLRRALAEWQRAQDSRDTDRYLALYSPDFTYRGLQFEEWAALRRAALQRPSALAIGIDELYLLADPVEAGVYLARFRHAVTADGITTVAVKRLYWREQDDGSLRIIAEDNG